MPVTRFVTAGLRSSIAALAMCTLGFQVVIAAEIDEQRKLFQSVYATVERGNWSAVDDLPLEQKQLLVNYVLWPDLRAAFYRATLGKADRDDVDSFLSQYGVLKPARDLRYRYALHLANVGDLPGYFSIYQQFYQGLDSAKLDCLALHAELEAGREQRIVNRALDLWMIGKSQVKECDPVFAFLASDQLLGRPDYQRRYDLSIEAREFSQARWLGKSIDQRHVDIANQWLKAQGNPESFIRNHQRWSDDTTTRAQLVYAIERLTYKDPVLALELWRDVSTSHNFSAEQEIRTTRHIALWTARDGLAGGYTLLRDLPQAAQNDEVLRWRARSSLRDRNWGNLLTDIAQMSTDERNTEEWQYWHGVAKELSGDSIAAKAAFTKLADQRSYYGFLAADELDLAYALDESEFVADEALIAQLANKPQLIRARELLLVGLDSRGRSEWDTVVSYLTRQQKIQAAILANRWGWHSRAISTAASVGEYGHLALRYPLPYLQLFSRFAKIASISPTWAYGVARSESLFMRDVRSRAGAIGLMQLMPATGRSVAQQIQLPYLGLATLTNPQHNIRLGTTYLGQMAERYGGNRVLATAAYNAGPHRVDRWLPDSGDIDARIWIENIPFNETRKYVRRVMAAETIFHWRMTGQMRRLSEELLLVQSSSKPQQVATIKP